MQTNLTIWKQALAEIGTRSTIQASDIIAVQAGATSPQEAFYCNLFYESIIEQALRAAHWNFAKTTRQLDLWKSLPGTPENQTQPSASGWSSQYPAPPWIYSYAYPSDCIQVRAILGQPQQVPFNPPIFSGTFQLAPPPISQRLPSGKFEIGIDNVDANGIPVASAQSVTAITIVSGGSGYIVGDTPTIPGTEFIPCRTLITQTTGGGVISKISLFFTAQSNSEIGDGYFPAPYPINPVPLTGGSGSGATVNLTLSPYGAQKVILTNLEQAIIEFTSLVIQEDLWDPDFQMIIIAALAGKLAIPLKGSRELARDKLTIANNIILEARVRDANEGLTINDHIPDWIRTRGVGGGLGYEMYFYPFGPLFPISPLV